MKKRFTLLSVLTIASSLTFAQNLPTLPTMKMNPTKFSANTSEMNNVISPKAGGDVIWENGFDATEADWTVGSVVGGNQGAWVKGTYPTQMTQYMGTFPAGTGSVASFNGIKHLLDAPTTPGGPGVPILEQDAFIESETIDLSASPMVTISWNQIYRRFNHDLTFVEVSTDDGTTWVSYAVNTNVTPHAASTKNTVFLDVSTASSATCKIRFRWQSLTADNDYGSGYGWAVDNVKVIEGYANNVSMLNLYSVVGGDSIHYTKMPADQTATAGNMSFGARAKNTGTDVQNIVLEVTSGTYSFTSSPVEVPALAIDSLSIDYANGFPLPSTLGMNTLTGTLLSNNTLEFTTDDSATLNFEVTQSVYAADGYDGTSASMAGSFTGWQNGVGDAEIGTYFEIFEDVSVGAIQIGIADVSAANQGEYVGRNIQGKIWDVTDATPVMVDASYEAPISVSSFGKIVKAYMISPFLLSAGRTYLVTAALSQGSPVPIAFAGTTIGGLVAGFNDGGIVGLRADDEIANTVGVPVVRLDFNDYTGINEIASKYELNVYPNPFSANTEVAFELKNDANVSINVTDITGRTVSTVDSQLYTSGSHTVSVDGTNLNAGVYNCTITIGNNVITKRIVKK